MTKQEKEALDNFVHTPAETSSNYVRFAEEIRAHPGVKLGGKLDKFIIPIRPGRKMGLLARPGHGKTSYGGFLVKSEANRILAAGESDKRYAVHISWEQPVEELEAMYQDSQGYDITDVAWGRVPMLDVTKDAIARPKLPVWLFGDSIYKTTLDTPPMTVERVYHAIQAIWKEWDMLPSILFLDFIQNIPVPTERDRYMQVSSAMRLVTRLAVQAKCPVIIGIQANQRTDDYKTPIPTMRDAEWSAVIGQLLDVLLALWRPIRTYLPTQEEFINVAGIDYPNTENLMVIKLLKQRFEKGHGIWAMDFNPASMVLKDYKTIDLNKLDDIPF